MKAKVFSFWMALIAIQFVQFLAAQQVPIPKPASYVYYNSSYMTGIDEIEIKNPGMGNQLTEDDLANMVAIRFGTSYGGWKRLYYRLHDNVFAELKNAFQHSRDLTMTNNGGWFAILEPDGIVQLIEIRENSPTKIYDVHTIAPTKEGLKAGKESASSLRKTFDLAGNQKQVIAFNEALTKKENEERAAYEAEQARKKAAQEAAAKAESEAKEKAIASRNAGLATADFCTPLTKYAAMVPNRFKSLKGKILPLDDMYQKGDTTFQATEVLQYFDFAKVQTRHKSYDNATDLDFYMKLESEAEVASKYEVAAGRLKTCFTEKAGWAMISLGSTCSFVKGKVAIMVRQYNNTWDDNGGNFLHLQVSSK